MRRFFIDRIENNKGLVSIGGSEARHISKVLRMGPGDRFILMDGTGQRHIVRIESVSSKAVVVTLEKALPKPVPSPVKIVLCQSLIKSRPMDYVIQKTSELGVNSICPFYSERSVVRLENNRHLNKLKHWREISKDAAKQSGRGVPADIEPISPLHILLERWKAVDAFKLMLWEEEDARDLKHLLREAPPSPLFIGIIGPEGGFTQNEVRAAREADFITVSLGSRILRSETAALTLVAIVQYEWGDLRK